MRVSRKIFSGIPGLLFLSICLMSCGTTRTISFSEAGNGRAPEVIRLNDNTEYRVYDFRVSSKISGDTLILFNRKNLEPYAYIPQSSISQMAGSGKMRKGSPLYYALIIIPLILLYK